MAETADELWWKYFAECGSSCGLPLPSRIPETAGTVMGYIFTMMQVADISGEIGSLTPARFFLDLAQKSPAAYQWVGRVMPGVLRVAFSRSVSGAVTGTGTVQLGRAAMTVGKAGVVGMGMVASAYLGYVAGAAIYASLRLRGFDLGAEGTTASDFFAWQQGNTNLTFSDWWGGALAAEQTGEDLKLKAATDKARATQAISNAERLKGIRVPDAIKNAIKHS